MKGGEGTHRKEGKRRGRRNRKQGQISSKRKGQRMGKMGKRW